MKLLVFAHTPPPHHGQSVMVQHLLEGFGGDHALNGPAGAGPSGEPPPFPIHCFHVNARLSDDLGDIGAVRPGKVLLLLRHVLRAIKLRLTRGVRLLYYIPSPPKRSSLYRDWLALLCLRPWFSTLVFHWHAAGLGAWLQSEGRPWERALSRLCLGRADLAIVVAGFNQTDAAWFAPKQIAVVENGIPDPCPDFATRVLPRRQARLAARRSLLAGEPSEPISRPAAGPDPYQVRVLFLAHCTRDKGLFDTIAGVARANDRLAASNTPLRLHLTVAGDFLEAGERAEFDRLRSAPDAAGWLDYAGFVQGPAKDRLLREADLFCFPTYYAAESFGLVLLEAMAHGLPMVATRWRSLPDLLPPGYPGLVEPRQPEQIAGRLIDLLVIDGARLRDGFLCRFTLEAHLERLAAALQGARNPPVR